MNASTNAQDIWMTTKAKPHVLSVLSPSAWRGESACAVGPFSNRETAEYFVDLGVRGQSGVTTENITIENIFVKGDSWYVEA